MHKSLANRYQYVMQAIEKAEFGHVSEMIIGPVLDTPTFPETIIVAHVLRRKLHDQG